MPPKVPALVKGGRGQGMWPCASSEGVTLGPRPAMPYVSGRLPPLRLEADWGLANLANRGMLSALTCRRPMK